MLSRVCALPALAAALCVSAVASEASPANEARAEMWVDLYTGEPVEFDAVAEDLTLADLVFLGEYHSVDRHHRWQRKIVSALGENERPFALGIEMMEKRYQPELDRYNSGEIDFDALAEATDWAENWDNYLDYKPVVEAARAAGAPVIALNADANIIRKIGREGLDALTEDERATLPDTIDLDDPPYYALLKLQLMVHSTVTEENLRNIFAAQVTRDETMAATMATFLKSEAGEGRRGVVLTGGGHCAYGYGTADRLQKAFPEAEARIVVMSDSGDVFIPEAMRAYMREIEITHQQLRAIIKRPLADYLSIIEINPDAEYSEPGQSDETN